MNNDTVISVQGVSKRYRIFDSSWARLRCALSPALASPAREVWALRNASFEVKRGEAVGIIGRNGSGKSTLLEIIAGTLRPTQGAVEVQGRVAALLELGSGFNPECTGRENVFLNGLLLGLTRAEIAERFDDIAGFADIGDVLDLPVKTYSSGMLVRLAFSVQVALEPEILIVDEALSVGDFFFQQKCFGHLRRMRERGLTLLFVSHDMGTVRNLCQKALYLREGRLEYWGEAKAAIQRYMNEQNQEPPPDAHDPAPDMALSPLALESLLCNALWRRNVQDALRGNCRLFGVDVLDREGRPATAVTVGDSILVRAYFRTLGPEHVHLSLSLKNRYDQIIFCTGSYLLGFDAISVKPGQFCVFEMEITCAIEAGEYSLLVSIGEPAAPNRGKCLDASEWFGVLHVQWEYEQRRAPFLGMFGLPATGRFLPLLSAFAEQLRTADAAENMGVARGPTPEP